MRNYEQNVKENINEVELFLTILVSLNQHISKIIYLVDNNIKDKRQIQVLSNSLLSLIDLSIVPFITENNLKIATWRRKMCMKVEKCYTAQGLAWLLTQIWEF